MPRPNLRLPSYDPKRPRLQAAAQVAVAVDEPGPSGLTNGGRWLAYDGSLIQLEIWGLNMQTDLHGCEYPEPVDIVTELATCRPYKGEIPALWNHYDEAIIGRWIDIEVTEAGVIASAILYDAATPAEAEAMELSTRIIGLVKRDHPLELSFGTSTPVEGLELIAPGAEVVVNGRTFVADQHVPLYVARNAIIDEISFCSRGACAQTRRLAASLFPHVEITPTAKPTPSKEPSMKLKARHLIATLTLLASAALGQRVSTGITAEIGKRVESAGEDADRDAIRSALMGELAEATGIDESTLGEIAAGKIDQPDEQVMAGLATVLGIPREELDAAAAKGDEVEAEAEEPTDEEKAAAAKAKAAADEAKDDEVVATAASLVTDPRIRGHESEVLKLLAKGKKPGAILLEIQDRRLAALEAKAKAQGKGGKEADGLPPGAGDGDAGDGFDLSGTAEQLRERYQASAKLQETFAFGADSFVAHAQRMQRQQRRR